MQQRANSKKINIREARPLLNKLSEEVDLNDSYYIITVRDKPKSILLKYDKKLVDVLEKKRQKKNKNMGGAFVSGITRWLSDNPPIVTSENVTSQIDEIVYG